MTTTLTRREHRLDPPLTAATAGARTAHINRTNPYPVADARDFATATGYDWHLPAGLVADLRQVVDALVSNAIDHAKWPDDRLAVALAISPLGRRVVVEVRDPDPTLPVWPGAVQVDISALLDDPSLDPDALAFTRGRGLADVAGRCETVTAFTEDESGKCVRAVLAIPEGGAS